jgi:hypothetical protein
MRNEIIRMWADWLGDGTNGVNAQIADVPRDAGDDAPPDLVAILDETTSGAAARGRVSKEQATPVLMVTLHDRFTVGPVEQGAYRDARNVKVALSLVVQESQTEKGLQEVNYLLRATERCVVAFFDNDNGSARTRNSVQIVHESYEVDEVPAYAEAGDAVIAGALIVTMHKVRDLAPTGS